MLRDGRGLEIATEAPEAVAAIDHFVEQFLGYGTEAVGVLRGLEADPGCVMVNAHAASLHLFLESAGAAGQAAGFLRAAEARAGRATERERLHLAAARAWAAGRPDLAAGHLREIVARWPRDLAAAKLAQYHLFNRGDLEGLLRIAEAALPANRDCAYAHGMLAFGLEQCHRLDEAEAAGRRATGMLRREPWAHHAVAHVMETQGRLDEGIAWMEALADTWSDCNSFMLTHNWWHLALFQIDADRPEAALDLYDRRVWGVNPDYAQDQINAISLLWRLDLRGVDVGNRWVDLGERVAARGFEHVEPFHDLHFIHALARGGGPAAAFLASLEAHAAAAPAYAAAAWREVALPVAQAILDVAAGKTGAAVRRLAPVVGRLQEIGGSHAQRDVFTQCWLDAALRAGQAAPVLETLRRRAAARPKVAIHRRQLAAAEAMVGTGRP